MVEPAVILLPGGSDRIPVMPGQDIAHRCGMTEGTGAIRGRGR